MSIIEFIIVALALSFEALIIMHGCASKNPIPLTKGIGESFTIAIINALLLSGGMLLGNLLRFSPENIDPNATSTNSLLSDTDNLVYLGLLILVALRLFFRSGKKSRQVQPYDISRYSTTLLLSVAIGINTLLVGLALGFRIKLSDNIWSATIPLVVIFTVMSFLGIMLGRQHKELRARRYTLVAVLFLLAFALKVMIWN